MLFRSRYYTHKRQRRIFYEWALISGQNDTPEQAHALGALLRGMDAHVNLIPLNPTRGYDERPSGPDAVRGFQDILASYGLPSTVRQRRGIDIDAGCGQLKAAVERKARAGSATGTHAGLEPSVSQFTPDTKSVSRLPESA